jgi:hypothetical protein
VKNFPKRQEILLSLGLIFFLFIQIAGGEISLARLLKFPQIYGKELSQAELEGKFVIVFWWSPLKEAERECKRGVELFLTQRKNWFCPGKMVLIGIVCEKGKQKKVVSLAHQRRYDFPLFELQGKYPFSYFPALVIFNPGGEIILKGTPYNWREVKWTLEIWEEERDFIWVEAKRFPEGIYRAEPWVSIGVARTGRVYMGVCTHWRGNNRGAVLVEYDPQFDTMKKVVEIEKVMKDTPPGKEYAWELPQLKIHTRLFEGKDGSIYGGTHVYDWREGPPVETYGGGHFFSYHPETGEFKDFGSPLKNKGVYGFVFDPKAEKLYGNLWPGGYLVSYDLKTGQFKQLGRTSSRELCTCELILLKDGCVYACDVRDGQIVRYNPKKKKIEKLPLFFPYGQRKKYEKDQVWFCAVAHPDGESFYALSFREWHLFKVDFSRHREGEVVNYGAAIPELVGKDAFYIGMVFGRNKKLYITGYSQNEENPGSTALITCFDPQTEKHLWTKKLRLRNYFDYDEHREMNVHQIRAATADSKGNIYFTGYYGKRGIKVDGPGSRRGLLIVNDPVFYPFEK